MRFVNDGERGVGDGGVLYKQPPCHSTERWVGMDTEQEYIVAPRAVRPAVVIAGQQAVKEAYETAQV